MDTLNFKEKLHFNEFPPISLKEWEKVILDDLKGKNYKETLRWSADKYLEVLPFYRSENLEQVDHHTQPLYSKTAWSIVEQIKIADLTQANKHALNALQNGASGLDFNLPTGSIKSLSDLEVLFKDIQIEFITVKFGANISTSEIAGLFSNFCEKHNLDLSAFNIFFAFDPFSMAALTGKLQPNNVIEETITEIGTCSVNANVYGNSGASITQQLAFALASGNELLGLRDSVSEHISFNFTTGNNYFPEIAKFRAFRLLWSQVLKEYELEDQSAHLHAETTLWNKAQNDAHNNLLRATTEAMSAAIGGCDSITVLPYNYHFDDSTEFSTRIARNIQLILQEEAYFDKVADPGAGSYYIEILTEKIAEQSWELFQEIESKGGFYECLKSGFIQDEIQDSQNRKVQLYKEKKETLVGVNKYRPEGFEIPSTKYQIPNLELGSFDDEYSIDIKKIEQLNMEVKLQKGDAS